MDAQTGIQNLVYSLGEGWGRAAMRIFIASTCLLLVFLLYAAHQFGGLRDAKSMEFAQLAQNLADGRGFVTHCLRPVDLGVLARAGREATPSAGIPDLRQAPAYPVLLSWGLRAVAPAREAPAPGKPFAPETQVILPFGFLCTLLCGLLLLFMGTRLFDGRVGVAAFGVFVVSDTVLQASISGGATPLAMVLTTATLCLALSATGLRARNAHPAAWIVATILAGILAGLVSLTVYALCVVPVIAIGMLAAGFVRWRALVIVLFLLAFTAVVAPWMVRNHSVSGHVLGLAPHSTLNHSALYAGDQWDREWYPRSESRDVVRALQLKFAENAGDLIARRLPVLGGGFVACFFLLMLFHRFDDEQVARLKWGVAGGLALCMAVVAFGNPTEESLMPFLPLVILASAAMVYRLLDQSPFLGAELHSMVVTGWVLLVSLPTLLTLAGPAGKWAYPPYAPTLIQYVGHMLKPGEIIATDIPAGVAWYGGRAALRLPRTTEALVQLRDEGLMLGGVYLTTATGDQPYLSALVEGAERSWRPLLDRFVPAGFPWQHGIALPPGTRDQILLTDADHWSASATPPSSASDGD